MLSVAPKEGPNGQIQLHATTVVIEGHAAAITGPAGTGKSSLALSLMAFGASLLADDITWLHADGGDVIASCPPQLSGRIEARGLGILYADSARPSPLAVIIDLGAPEQDRLPPMRTIPILGQQIALLHTPATPHFAPMILRYMLGGRSEGLIDS